MAEIRHFPGTRFAWLAIVAACATIVLKTGAWLTTGSVGLLSDAMAKKYLDVDAYPYRIATDTRVTFIIEPVRTIAS